MTTRDALKACVNALELRMSRSSPWTCPECLITCGFHDDDCQIGKALAICKVALAQPDAAEVERAKIVAWLGAFADDCQAHDDEESSDLIVEAVSAIELGEHLKSTTEAG